MYILAYFYRIVKQKPKINATANLKKPFFFHIFTKKDKLAQNIQNRLVYKNERTQADF